MKKNILTVSLIFVLGFFCIEGSSKAQEMADLSDPSKQISRDKLLLEIWKDNVRKLTRERDDAFKRIQELKTAPPSSSGDLAEEPQVRQLLEEKQSALREAEAARSREQEALSRVESLKLLVNKLENDETSRTDAQARPEDTEQPESSREFYAQLTKNYTLQQEKIKQMKAELAQLRSEAEDLRSKGQSLAVQNEQLRNSAGLLKNAQDELQKANANNHSLQELMEKIRIEDRALQDQKAGLNLENKNLNARVQQETEKTKALEAKLNDALAQVEEARKETERVDREHVAEIEDLRTKLKSNASDIQNLKENLATMLEPIVSSFDKRQKVV